MRTQTKIRNKKIMGWVLDIALFIATVWMLTLCYQKFQVENARAQLHPSSTERAVPILGPSILQEFLGKSFARGAV